MPIRARQLLRLVAVALTSVLMVLGPATLPSASAAPTDTAKTGLCWHREWFGGQHYCPATARGVLASKYGVGRRVHVDAVLLAAAYDDHLLFEVPDCSTCPEAVFLEVPWKPPHRPVNDHSGPYTRQSFRIYGTTTAGGLVPAGYVTTGRCYWEPACGD